MRNNSIITEKRQQQSMVPAWTDEDADDITEFRDPIPETSELKAAMKEFKKNKRSAPLVYASLPQEIRSFCEQSTAANDRSEQSAQENGRLDFGSVDAQLLKSARQRCERLQKRYDSLHANFMEREGVHRELKLELETDAAAALELQDGKANPTHHIQEQLEEIEAKIVVSIQEGKVLKHMLQRARSDRRDARSRIEIQQQVTSDLDGHAADSVNLALTAAKSLRDVRLRASEAREALREQRTTLQKLADLRREEKRKVEAIEEAEIHEQQTQVMARLSIEGDLDEKGELRLINRASEMARARIAMALNSAVAGARERSLEHNFHRLRLAMPDPAQLRNPAQLVKVALKRSERTKSLQLQRDAALQRLEAARAELERLREEGHLRGLTDYTLGIGLTDSRSSDSKAKPGENRSTAGNRRGSIVAAVMKEENFTSVALEHARRRAERLSSRLTEMRQLLSNVRQGTGSLLASVLGEEQIPSSSELPDRLEFVGKYLSKLNSRLMSVDFLQTEYGEKADDSFTSVRRGKTSPSKSERMERQAASLRASKAGNVRIEPMEVTEAKLYESAKKEIGKEEEAMREDKIRAARGRRSLSCSVSTAKE